MAEARSVERRDRFDGITKGEVCGTPDKVNGEKSKNDGSAIQPRARSGNRPGEVCNNCRGFRGHGLTHERQWQPENLGAGPCCCNVLSLLCSLREDSRSVVMSQLTLNHYHENASKRLLRARFRQGSSLG